MPLLFYLGNHPKRSVEALNAREQRMIERGWGPNSLNRQAHMAALEAMGKGRPGRFNKGKGKGKTEDEGEGIPYVESFTRVGGDGHS